LKDDLWLEFVRKDLCGLCGNLGVIDTRATAVSPVGVRCGDLHFCICPNGRQLKESSATIEACYRYASENAGRSGGAG
jgi:hypothetical protein